MAIWEDEGRERFSIDRENLNHFIRSTRSIHKIELDELMVNYITDNNLELKDIELIRLFVKYLKEQ